MDRNNNNFKNNSINKWGGVFEFNQKVFEYYSMFIDDKDLLICALIQNPFNETKDLDKIKKNFGIGVFENFKKLNKLHNADATIFENYSEYKPLITLFLINYKLTLALQKKIPQIESFISPKKIEYAMELLLQFDISKIREGLEDEFFSISNPEIFKNYISILNFSKSNYQKHQKKTLKELKKILKEKNIYNHIESRFKSIQSIHKKIIKKNILLSQVLDIIGFRIVTKHERECYKAMSSIISQWPVINTKIKDFIALPKSNGYQSIHLTILIENHPIEIQIRTEEMHQYAQYGKASHFLYKHQDRVHTPINYKKLIHIAQPQKKS